MVMQLDELKTRFKSVADRVDAMSLRERGLIFVTILVLLYFLAVNVLFGPANAEKDRLQAQLNQIRLETQALDTQIESILAGRTQDPDAAKRERIAALQANLRQMDAALNQATFGLVPPREMTRLVEQMLSKNHGLRVLKVESLPAAPLVEGGAQANGTDGVMLYKHGMRIEVQGSYLDMLRYLKSLEGLPWKVFWGQVTLKSDKYPESRFSLLIYTLSTHEASMGL
jgi:MSHA biogenesis protein MshJ